MLSYLGRRLLYAAATFVGITLVVFLLIHVVPGDPIRLRAAEARPGAALTPAVLSQLRHTYGLDRPLLVQYAHWLGEVVRLDFGRSQVDARPVRERIGEKLPNTLLLNGVAFVLSLLLAIPLGIASAARAGRKLDRGSGAVLMLLYSLPNFWVGLVLIELLAVRLGVLPLYGMTSQGYAEMAWWQQVGDRAAHLMLPLITLSYAQVAVFSRFCRAAVLEVISKEFIIAARARGAGELRVVMAHAFRNALLPLITLVGFTVPFLLSGSVVVEKIFEWDGLGRLYIDAVMARDYPTVMGLTVLTAIVTLGAYFLTDIAYAAADPRIRLEGKR